MDFEEATRRKVDPVHWAYLASGVDDDATLRANRECQRARNVPPGGVRRPITARERGVKRV
jgi:hypothetical protein